SGELGLVDLELKEVRRGVDRDEVAVLDEGDGPAHRRLRRDVPDDEPVGTTGEAPVRYQRDGVAEAVADYRAGRRQHLPHAGAALGALVADHDDVARVYQSGENRGHGGFLAIEHARRPGM